MATITADQILEAIGSMTVLELSDLKKAFEEQVRRDRRSARRRGRRQRPGRRRPRPSSRSRPSSAPC